MEIFYSKALKTYKRCIRWDKGNDPRPRYVCNSSKTKCIDCVDNPTNKDCTTNASRISQRECMDKCNFRETSFSCLPDANLRKRCQPNSKPMQLGPKVFGKIDDCLASGCGYSCMKDTKRSDPANCNTISYSASGGYMTQSICYEKCQPKWGMQRRKCEKEFIRL